jgi:hypothetical protein
MMRTFPVELPLVILTHALITPPGPVFADAEGPTSSTHVAATSATNERRTTAFKPIPPLLMRISGETIDKRPLRCQMLVWATSRDGGIQQVV